MSKIKNSVFSKLVVNVRYVHYESSIQEVIFFYTVGAFLKYTLENFPSLHFTLEGGSVFMGGDGISKTYFITLHKY